jgi:hypothetical protein
VCWTEVGGGGCLCGNKLQCLLPGPHYIHDRPDLMQEYKRGHSAIGLELDIDALETLTVDSRFFCQVGLVGKCLTFTQEVELDAQQQKAELVCIEEYPREPMDKENYARHINPEVGASLEIVAKQLHFVGLRWQFVWEKNMYKWCAHAENEKKLIEVENIFAAKCQTDTGSTRKVCYNEKCLRRSHQYMTKFLSRIRERDLCAGRQKCQCLGHSADSRMTSA